jgi:hypothetical protein
MDENSPLDATIDMDVFKTYINKNLATIGLTNLISDVKLREKPVEPELDLTDDDMDSVSLEDETDYTQPE